VRRFRAELGEDARVIATGGLAELVGAELQGEACGCFDFIDPWLTLEGLRLVWTRHHPEAAEAAAGAEVPEGTAA
jgi:type III pantothenate kinase